MNVTGKRVLITNGATGIGFALARVLLAKGAKVAISGRCPEIMSKAVELLQTGSAEIHGITSDVVTADGRDARLEQAVAALGGLDVLVNNACGKGGGRLENTDEAKLQAVIDVTGPIFLTQAALPMLRDSCGATVVNICSESALAGKPFYAIYAAVKAGLVHVSEALRRELRRQGIHVLTAFPEGTEMPMIRANNTMPVIGSLPRPTSATAEAIVRGIEVGATDLIRDGEGRTV